MTDYAKTHVLFVDLETTGFSPKDDVPLEIAFILASVDRNGVRYIARSSRNLKYLSWVERAMDQADPVVQKMHAESGLVDAMKARGEPTVGAMEAGILRDLDSVSPPGTDLSSPRTICLAGNSVWFDRQFIEHYMPEFALRLSHRMIDVSSLGLVMESIDPRWRLMAKSINGATKHRALTDCYESLSLLRIYMHAMRVDTMKLSDAEVRHTVSAMMEKV